MSVFFLNIIMTIALASIATGVYGALSAAKYND